LLLLASLVILGFAHSAEPRIRPLEKTNILGRTVMAIHFDYEPNRTYVLQSIASLPCQTCSTSSLQTSWSNLFAPPSSQGSGTWHYYDPPTNRARFYRLRVTP
jgi:hypothetical protein